MFDVQLEQEAGQTIFNQVLFTQARAALQVIPSNTRLAVVAQILASLAIICAGKQTAIFGSKVIICAEPAGAGRGSQSLRPGPSIAVARGAIISQVQAFLAVMIALFKLNFKIYSNTVRSTNNKRRRR